MILPFIYSYLFIANEDWGLQPDLATAYEYHADTLTWTIHIRGDVFFHDGRRLTADDVKYSLETVLKTHNPSVHAMINRIEAMGPSSLAISIDRNDHDFLRKLWCIEIVPRPNSQSDVSEMRPIIGSGPFRLESRQARQKVTLVANDQYYGGRPALERVAFYSIADMQKSWARLLAGETDLAFGIEPKDFGIMAQYKDQFSWNLTTEPYRTLLLYNTYDPLFSDPRVRQALAYAVDKDYIVGTILQGLGVKAVGTMGHHSPFSSPELQPTPYDPQKSMQLLYEAGWSYDPKEGYLRKEGRYFEFTILFHRDVELHKRVAQYLRLCFNDIGIKTRLEPMVYDDLKCRFDSNNDFQAVLTDYIEIYSDSMLERFWSRIDGKQALAGCFQNPQVTELINKAIQETDFRKKRDILYDLDSLLTSLQPGLFLYQKASLSILSKRFRSNFSFFSSVFARFRLWRLSPAEK